MLQMKRYVFISNYLCRHTFTEYIYMMRSVSFALAELYEFAREYCGHWNNEHIYMDGMKRNI